MITTFFVLLFVTLLFYGVRSFIVVMATDDDAQRFFCILEGLWNIVMLVLLFVVWARV